MSLAGGDWETDAEGFVLAGGRSSRMGRDKALIEIAGETLVERAARILRDAGLGVSIAGARAGVSDRLEWLGPMIPDAEADRGPLAGVCAALRVLRGRWAVFVPVDAPLVPSALIGYLLEHARMTERMVTVASVNGFVQTFPAVLTKEVLPLLERELGAGRGGCIAAFEAAALASGERISVLPVEVLAQAEKIAGPAVYPAARWLMNVNTPLELDRVSRVCGLRVSLAPVFPTRGA